MRPSVCNSEQQVIHRPFTLGVFDNERCECSLCNGGFQRRVHYIPKLVHSPIDAVLFNTSTHFSTVDVLGVWLRLTLIVVFGR